MDIEPFRVLPRPTGGNARLYPVVTPVRENGALAIGIQRNRVAVNRRIYEAVSRRHTNGNCAAVHLGPYRVNNRPRTGNDLSLACLYGYGHVRAGEKKQLALRISRRERSPRDSRQLEPPAFPHVAIEGFRKARVHVGRNRIQGLQGITEGLAFEDYRGESAGRPSDFSPSAVWPVISPGLVRPPAGGPGSGEVDEIELSLGIYRGRDGALIARIELIKERRVDLALSDGNRGRAVKDICRGCSSRRR